MLDLLNTISVLILKFKSYIVLAALHVIAPAGAPDIVPSDSI